MLTHFKWTMHVLYMLIHLTSGHVTLLYGNFNTLYRTYGIGWTQVEFCLKFVFPIARSLSSVSDCREILHHDAKCVRFYNLASKFFL